MTCNADTCDTRQQCAGDEKKPRLRRKVCPSRALGSSAGFVKMPASAGWTASLGARMRNACISYEYENLPGLSSTEIHAGSRPLSEVLQARRVHASGGILHDAVMRAHLDLSKKKVDRTTITAQQARPRVDSLESPITRDRVLFKTGPDLFPGPTKAARNTATLLNDHIPQLPSQRRRALANRRGRKPNQSLSRHWTPEVRIAQRQTAKASAQAKQKSLDDANTVVNGERKSKSKAYEDAVWLKPGTANKGHGRKCPHSPITPAEDADAIIPTHRRKIVDGTDGPSNLADDGDTHGGNGGDAMAVDGINEGCGNEEDDDNPGIMMGDDGDVPKETEDRGDRETLACDNARTQADSGDDDSDAEYAPSVQLEDGEGSEGGDIEDDEAFIEPERGASSKALACARRSIQAQLDLANAHVVDVNMVADSAVKQSRVVDVDSDVVLGDEDDHGRVVVAHTAPSQLSASKRGKGNGSVSISPCSSPPRISSRLILMDCNVPRTIVGVSRPRPRLVFKPAVPTRGQDIFDAGAEALDKVCNHAHFGRGDLTELGPRPASQAHASTGGQPRTKFKPVRHPVPMPPPPPPMNMSMEAMDDEEHSVVPPILHPQASSPVPVEAEVAEVKFLAEETEPIYVDQGRSIVARLCAQHGLVKELLSYACNLSLAELLFTRNPFPGHSTLLEMAEESLHISAQRQNLDAIKQRLEEDHAYSRSLAPLARTSVPSFATALTRVYHQAEAIVPTAYKLHQFMGDPLKMALAVGGLLSDYGYLYPGSFKSGNPQWRIKDRALLFYHPAFAQIALKAFMDGDPYRFHETIFPLNTVDPKRHELPDVMVAFIGVAIHAVLQLYVTGEKARRAFDAARVREAYNDHLATIDSRGFAAGKHAIFRDLYSDARKLVGRKSGIARTIAPGAMNDIEARLKRSREDNNDDDE
ncbi:hypothetical protein K488DRAFT_74954 [Vararia minispora EC-137]|uniref:Uncharacterized protein n=1 Tax=Vararia minispora EC-137 TaxID=1314806 RepID=A0ACB8Q5H1_9AGAM|nr:hypothetical protein K488DRAFT_74954 [Vararia minispora EC-137]